jgi:hypothetical protein
MTNGAAIIKAAATGVTRLAVLLAATAGPARADGRWIAPTNGWSHNYVASVGEGPGSGRPEQADGKWTRSGYQHSDPEAANYAAVITDGTEGDVLALAHRETTGSIYPLYVMETAPGAGASNDLITLDCRFRLADESQPDTTAQFFLGVARPRHDGAEGMIQWVIQCRKSGLNYLSSGGSITAISGTPLGTNWHTVRMVIDAAAETAALYLDSAAVPVAAWAGEKRSSPSYNRIVFGDGSGGIMGAVNVKFLRWAVDELVAPVLLHEGTADPAAEGWAYDTTARTLDYAASNGVLPTAASPAWRGWGWEAGTASLVEDEATGEAALHLVMTNATSPNAHYYQLNPEGQFTTNDLATCRLRFRLMDDTLPAGTAQLVWNMYGPRTDGESGSQRFYMQFCRNRIQYWDNNTFTEWPVALDTNWHDAVWVLNFKSREAQAYLDGGGTAVFTHKSQMTAVERNWVMFGDGSGSEDVKGVARVSHVSVTRQGPAWGSGIEEEMPYWEGIGYGTASGCYRQTLPVQTAGHARGWTASCNLRLVTAYPGNADAGMVVRDGINQWGMLFTAGGIHWVNASTNTVRLADFSRADRYHTFQLHYDPDGDAGNGTVSYYDNGWLKGTVTRTDTLGRADTPGAFVWGGIGDATTGTQRWNRVEFAHGNRVIAPVQPAGTVIRVR